MPISLKGKFTRAIAYLLGTALWCGVMMGIVLAHHALKLWPRFSEEDYLYLHIACPLFTAFSWVFIALALAARALGFVTTNEERPKFRSGKYRPVVFDEQD
jgi:hypothetical protein